VSADLPIYAVLPELLASLREQTAAVLVTLNSFQGPSILAEPGSKRKNGC
jgi:hypothetical protein